MDILTNITAIAHIATENANEFIYDTNSRVKEFQLANLIVDVQYSTNQTTNGKTMYSAFITGRNKKR